MRKTLIALASLAFFIALGGSAVADAACNYYVSNSGNDSADGTTQATAWQTISRVNQQSLSPGNTVCFKTGDMWRLPTDAYLEPVSGSSSGYVTYTSYDSGPKPIFLGSVEMNSTSDWYLTGTPNVWATADNSFGNAVGNLIFNNEESTGTMDRFNISNLDQQGEYHYDTSRKRLVMYSTSNPATYYTDIECALHKHMFTLNGHSYVKFSDFDIRYGGSHGISGANESHHLVISDNDLSYIGGAIQVGVTRYGNAIQMWGSTNDIYVERNRIWQVYDAALTTQGLVTNQMYNHYYRYNVIWDVRYCFEYWNNPSSSITDNIYFENNTCVNSITDLTFYANSAQTTNFYIRNNIFYEPVGKSLFIPDYPDLPWNGYNNLVLDYNAYYKSTDADYPAMVSYPPCVWEPQGRWLICMKYTMDDFAAYQADSGKDPNSITADPFFVDMANNDYRPTAGSPVCTASSSGSYIGALPCIAVGINPYDYDQDWVIGDFELLDAIDDWTAGSLTDLELQDLINFWVAGCYQWDPVTESNKPGCIGNTCTFDQPVRTVGAPPGHNYYFSPQSGYDAAEDGDTIQIQDKSLTGDLNINMDKSVSLTGGYDCDYINNTGTTVLNGEMNITSGLVTIDSGAMKIE